MLLSSAGDLGIGTTAPVMSSTSYNGLHVNATYPAIKLTADATGHAAADGYHLRIDSTPRVEHWNYENSAMIFATNNLQRFEIEAGGDVVVNDGDLYFETAGKGIVLGATSNTAANTLDDYEEGTWTPTWSGANASNATYTKIGRVVYASGTFQATGSGTTGDCAGLPYTSAIDGSDGGGSGYHGQDTVSWSILKTLNSGFRFYTGSTQKQLTSSNGTRFFLTYHV
jgi:hypothetical protein